jgi:tRNA (adenine-N(1)-)-methyltransferase non-catalytic subunit
VLTTALRPRCQVLTEAQAKLRAEAGYLNPIVTESWLRHYQVLPGRSHPFMGMSGTGGFLLSALKVLVRHRCSRPS